MKSPSSYTSSDFCFLQRASRQEKSKNELIAGSFLWVLVRPNNRTIGDVSEESRRKVYSVQSIDAH